MDHTQTMAWWEKQAPTYFTDKVFTFSQPQLIDKLNITPDSRVLEIGFGYGRELSQFCKLSDHVYGVELFPVTCEIAEEQLRQQGIASMPSLHVYDGEKLPFDDGTVDVVYSCYVLQHMSRPAARELIREALRVTTQGGCVLMEFFGDPEYHHAVEDRFSGDPDNGGMYNNAYDEQSVTALTLGLGEVIGIEPQLVSTGDSTFHNYWQRITPFTKESAESDTT